MVRDQIQKQFSDKVLYNYSSKFFFGAFWSVFKKIKNGFPIVFSKNDLGGGSFFAEFFF